MEQVFRLTRFAPSLAIVLALFVAPAGAQFGMNTRFELSDRVRVDEVDNETKAHLANARDMVAIGQWDEAIDTLRQVLANHGGRVISIHDRRYVSLRNYCHMQLAALPSEALAIYRARVDAQAGRRYEAALARRDEAGLRTVVNDFFCSSYGDDALLALGELALERGDYAAARGYWEQLLTQPASVITAQRFREVLADGQLSADSRRLLEEAYVLFTADGQARYVLRDTGETPSDKLALAAIKSQYKLPQVHLEYPDADIPPADVLARLALVSILENSAERAAREINWLEQLFPSASGQLGGRRGNLVGLLQQLLSDSGSWPGPTPTDDWPTFAGSFERNKVARRMLDVGAVKWRRPLPPPPPADLGFSPRRIGEDTNTLLSYHPVVFNDVVLVNTEHEIRAYNLHTGEPAWGDTPAIPLDKSPGQIGRHSRNALGTPRFTMSVQAGRLFARMGNPVTSSPADPFAQAREGYLICLDLTQQGKLVWRSGHGSAFAPPPGENWSFEGSPVCDGANVYVAMRRGGVRPQAHVACLDAETGRLRWQQMICSAETPGQGQTDECTHNLLTLAGDTLYYNTNLGAVASLSARDGQIHWITLYERARSGDLNSRPSHFYRDLTPCVLDRGKLFVAPSDTHYILAIDAPSGMFLWQSGHPVDAVHLLGVGGGNLLAAGDKLWAINTSTGKLAFRAWPEGPSPKGHGRGALAGDMVLFPTRSAIEVFDQASGQHLREIALTPRGVDGGNLLVVGDYLLIVTSHEIIALDESARESIPSAELSQTAAAPSDSDEPALRPTSAGPLGRFRAVQPGRIPNLPDVD